MRAMLACNGHFTCSRAISSSGVSRLDQIDQPKYQKTTLTVKQPVVIEDLIRYTKYFFEHQKKTTEVSDVFQRYWRLMITWLSISDDYRTLIGLDSLGVVERDDDDEDVENNDV